MDGLQLTDAVFDSKLLPVNDASSEDEFQTKPVAQPEGYQVQSDGVLKIMGGLNIGAATALHRALDEYVGCGSDLVLDLSAANDCDTAALQLIYSLGRTAFERKQRFYIAAVSPEIEEIATTLGLQIKQLSSSDAGLADAHSGSGSTDGGI